MTKPLILTAAAAALIVVAMAPAVLGESHGPVWNTVSLSGKAPKQATIADSESAEQPDGDKATGGGQILFSTQGAGNTIAFNAQQTDEGAKGQLQFIDRSGGNGQDQVREHGEVTCIDAEDNTAKIGGVLRDGRAFNLVVVDNGEGANAENDMIFYNSMAQSPDCDFDDPDEDDFVALARGNVQVYDAG